MRFHKLVSVNDDPVSTTMLEQHRRLLIPEKPLYSWALWPARHGLGGVRWCSRKIVSILANELECGDAFPLILLFIWPCFLVIKLVLLAIMVVPLAFCLVGLCLWLALLPVSLGLSLLGMVLAVVAGVYPWYRRWRGVTLRCKHGGCEFRDVRLAYCCPRCGQRYTHVVPSHLGILYHSCTCGGRIPVVRRLGREELKKACPMCGRYWVHGQDALPECFVAVVGGTSVGKTCYLAMVTKALRNGSAEQRPGKAEFESSVDAGYHDSQIRHLQEGRRPVPTQFGVPDALVMRLHNGGNRQTRLYLYDAAGEEYRRVERALEEEFVFFRDLTGIILIIDPLGLPGLRGEVEASTGSEAKALEVSDTPLADVVAGMRRNIRRYLRYGRSGCRDVAVAVVVNKVDVELVRERIGEEAVRRSGMGEDETVRQALMSWGAGDEVLALEGDFPRIRYDDAIRLSRVS